MTDLHSEMSNSNKGINQTFLIGTANRLRRRIIGGLKMFLASRSAMHTKPKKGSNKRPPTLEILATSLTRSQCR